MPCTAAVGLVLGLVWHWKYREEFEGLPSIFPALRKLALVISGLQVLATVAFTLCYALLRT